MGESSVQYGIRTKERTRHMTPSQRAARIQLHEEMHEAIKNKTPFSIVQRSIELGLYKPKK